MHLKYMYNLYFKLFNIQENGKIVSFLTAVMINNFDWNRY